MDFATVISETIDRATPWSKGVFGGPRTMSATDVQDFIDEYPVALVSTVDRRGAPHVVGKAAVLLDGRLYLGARRGTALGWGAPSDGSPGRVGG